MKREKERRYDWYGEYVLIERTQKGYVIARRPRCSAHLFTVQEWDAMPREPVLSPANS
jgi:hypothetical protein